MAVKNMSDVRELLDYLATSSALSNRVTTECREAVSIIDQQNKPAAPVKKITFSCNVHTLKGGCTHEQIAQFFNQHNTCQVLSVIRIFADDVTMVLYSVRGDMSKWQNEIITLPTTGDVALFFEQNRETHFPIEIITSNQKNKFSVLFRRKLN